MQTIGIDDDLNLALFRLHHEVCLSWIEGRWEEAEPLLLRA